MVQYQARTKSRQQEASLRQGSEQLAQLEAQHKRLAILAAQNRDSQDQSNELQKLRGQAESLRQQTNNLARLREEHRKRQSAETQPKTPLQIQEEMVAKGQFEMNWLRAFRDYAKKNQGQIPANFAQASAFLPSNFNGVTNITTDQFEIVSRGQMWMTNSGDVIILREKEPWQNNEGRWCKVYGIADGHVQTLGVPFVWTDETGHRISYDSFEVFEKEHIIPPPAP